MKTVVHYVDGRYFGGTERVVLQLLEGMDPRRFRSVLLHHPEPGIEPLLAGARRLRVETLSVPRMDRFGDARKLPAFVRALRSVDAAVLHAHLSWPLACKYGLIGASIAKLPAVVATAHLECDLSARMLLRVQPRLIATRVDRYFAVSRAVAEQLSGQLAIPAAKVRCISNGISLAEFERPPDAALRAMLTMGSERPVVLSVASLEPRKGQMHLLEAAKRVPEAVFVLVGEGPDRAALEEQARALDIRDRVSFLGSRDDVPDLMANCDVFVLPSFAEGMPLSILEAMAAGKPVIASAIGGIDEAVVHGSTGLLVAPGNSAELAATIASVVNDSALAQRLGAAGRARAREHYSVERMVRRTMEAYREILRGHEPQSA